WLRPSGPSAHVPASLFPLSCPGTGGPPASGPVYRMRTGGICGGAVEGSNQVGAIVMGQAMTASPAGDDWPVASQAAPSESKTSAGSSTIRPLSRPPTVVPIRFPPSSALAPDQSLARVLPAVGRVAGGSMGSKTDCRRPAYSALESSHVPRAHASRCLHVGITTHIRTRWMTLNYRDALRKVAGVTGAAYRNFRRRPRAEDGRAKTSSSMP